MGTKTGIEWTDSTANPLLARRLEDGKVGFHCVKVSAECAMCYAETFNERNLPNRGTGLAYVKGSGALVEMILHQPAFDAIRRLGPVVIDKETGQTRTRRVFWCSMTDLFGEFVPSALIQAALDEIVSIGEDRGHIAQLLTKRPQRMLAEMADWSRRHSDRRLPGFVWPGFSAGQRDLFRQRWPVHGEIARFAEGPLWCSYEPSIGPLVNPRLAMEEFYWRMTYEQGLRWLIWGGESGSQARPFNALWALDVVRLVAHAGIAVFGKQFGARPFCPVETGDRAYSDAQEVIGKFYERRLRIVTAGGDELEKLKRGVGAVVHAKFGHKGADGFDDWPEMLKLRQFPGGGSC